MIDEQKSGSFAPKSLNELTNYFKQKEALRIQHEQRKQQLYIAFTKES